MEYGYVRVSTIKQKEDRQIECIKNLGIKKIYVEKCSGNTFQRNVYKKLIKKLKQNDILYIKSIDRLGRNYKEIMENWRILTKDKKVDIVVIDMPLLDTRVYKDLMGSFISDIVLNILSFVAENERINIKERQKEGIRIAKQKGVKFGRPKKEFGEEFENYLIMYENGEISRKNLAKIYNVSEKTIYRRIQEIKKN